MEQIKLLVIGDLHGNIPNINQNDFDAIIAPGDFCSDNLRRYMFEAVKMNIKNTKKKIRWEDLTGKELGKKEVEISLQNGRKILEYLNSFNKPVFLVPGNWDWTSCESKWDYLKKDHFKILLKGLRNLINCHFKKVEFKGIVIIGSGISSGPEIPQYPEEIKNISQAKLVKKKKRYNQNFKTLSEYFKNEKRPILFLSHNVPFNTSIDEITNKDSPRCGYHYGSLLTRKLIDKYQPMLCIGGHMHEHFKATEIKKTICINAGFGPNVNVSLIIENSRIKKMDFLKYDK